jgi:hypothetical protein
MGEVACPPPSIMSSLYLQNLKISVDIESWLREHTIWYTVHEINEIFRLSAKRTSPFKSAGTSVQSTTGSQAVRISGSNAGYTTFRGIVKCTGYPLHSPVSPSLPLPCVTVCHHISTGLYPHISVSQDTASRLLVERERERGRERIGIIHSNSYCGLFYCKLKLLECNANNLRPSMRKVKEERRFALTRIIGFTVGCMGPVFLLILLWGWVERDTISVICVYFVL